MAWFLIEAASIPRLSTMMFGSNVRIPVGKHEYAIRCNSYIGQCFSCVSLFIVPSWWVFLFEPSYWIKHLLHLLNLCISIIDSPSLLVSVGQIPTFAPVSPSSFMVNTQKLMGYLPSGNLLHSYWDHCIIFNGKTHYKSSIANVKTPEGKTQKNWSLLLLEFLPSPIHQSHSTRDLKSPTPTDTAEQLSLGIISVPRHNRHKKTRRYLVYFWGFYGGFHKWPLRNPKIAGWFLVSKTWRISNGLKFWETSISNRYHIYKYISYHTYIYIL